MGAVEWEYFEWISVLQASGACARDALEQCRSPRHTPDEWAQYF